MTRQEQAADILEKIKDLMHDLDSVFRAEGGLTWERYKMYPRGHITMSLSNDHDYLGKETFTVQELIDDLDDGDDSEDDADDE